MLTKYDLDRIGKERTAFVTTGGERIAGKVTSYGRRQVRIEYEWCGKLQAGVFDRHDLSIESAK